MHFDSLLVVRSVLYRLAFRKTIVRKQHFKSKDHCNIRKQSNARYNVLGIQMLSESLHKQVFKACYTGNYSQNVDEEKLNECIKHLSTFGLSNADCKTLQEIDFDLPELSGVNINEHFQNIAKEQTDSYKNCLHKLINKKIPPMPEISLWQRSAGWTKYIKNNDGSTDVKSVECPDSSALVFDCEVLASHSDIPIIAVAVSSDAWFSWTSKHVLKENSELKNDIEHLIPMECGNDIPKSSKIVVGHNVGYDRARVKEQYYLNPTRTRFLDTMSMHIAVSGFSSQQRISSKLSSGKETSPSLDSSWVQAGSLNNLNAVHEFYCGKALDKSAREIFVSGTMKDVQNDFNALMEYCANDVQATFNVLAKLLPLFFSHFPHHATFAGMLELGQMYLPINNNWQRYVHSCQQEYANLNLELKRTLIDRMNDACHLLHDENYKNDKWLWDLDWSIKYKKMIKNPRKGFVPKNLEEFKLKHYFYQADYFSLEEQRALGKIPTNDSQDYPLIEEILKTANRMPLVTSHMPGCPQWYKDLQEKEKDPTWSHDSCKLSTQTRSTPRLLRLTWLGYPLHHCDKLGWGYLVPRYEKRLDEVGLNDISEDDLKEVKENEWRPSSAGIVRTPAEDVDGLFDGCVFHRLPHKDGIGKNVGSPLSQDFIHHIESGSLSSSDYSNARRCLEINKLCSYWRSTQKRILTQMRIYLNEKYLPKTVAELCSKNLGYGAIVPQVIVCGAISRRAVERTWLTASNIESDRIGSELKTMIQAPPGYCFVGADVDSQELWIASLLGDASCIGEHGCTALSWMTLQGNKKDGTDLHSKTAQAIGMTRNEAKTFNYARMYGAGKQAALRNFMQHNPNESKEECVDRINKLYDMTKGKLLYRLNANALWIMKKTNVQIDSSAELTNFATYEDLQKIYRAGHDAFGHAKVFNMSELIDGKKWVGGIESQMFNKLEEIAKSKVPETPVLKCQISNALQPSKVGCNFLPSRMNWVVQSSAVDYLHLLVVAMRWLIEKYNLDARFILSIHDEVRFLAAVKDQYKVALALQIANLLTRCMFAYQLGMRDLPLSCAFFSCVEIDQVIRKEASNNCVTPSNAGGLETQYGIPRGKSLDIFDILKATNGKFRA